MSEDEKGLDGGGIGGQSGEEGGDLHDDDELMERSDVLIGGFASMGDR